MIKPSVLALITRCFEFRQRQRIGLAIAAFVPLSEAALLPETAMWPFLAEEVPPDQPLDAGIPKSRPEFLAVAKAYAPEGSSITRIRTEITLGAVTKRLDAFGDRTFHDGRFTDPTPFAEIPLDWAHTYGGNGIADNPSGKGAGLGKLQAPVKVQNVINPDVPHPARMQASYGPVDQMWPARARRAGTYDDAWLKKDFPGFPRDIDWLFFNLAQPDQWLPNPLAGNEKFAPVNLHPVHRRIEGWLPGVVPRLFLVRKNANGDGSFEEVPMAPTTVWFFPHRERMVLVYHGSAAIAEEDASDIARAVLGADRMGELSPAAHFRAVMEKRTAKGGGIHALNDADLVPAEWLRPDLALAGSPEEKVARKAIQARGRRRAERERSAAVENLKARGLDPAKYQLPLLPDEAEPPTLEELPKFAEAMRKEAEQKKAEALALIEQKKPRPPGAWQRPASPRRKSENAWRPSRNVRRLSPPPACARRSKASLQRSLRSASRRTNSRPSFSLRRRSRIGRRRKLPCARVTNSRRTFRVPQPGFRSNGAQKSAA
ncbi:MAG: DUF2169 family type VI secretion system accessory protein [Acetobacteraceae bacterium]